MFFFSPFSRFQWQDKDDGSCESKEELERRRGLRKLTEAAVTKGFKIKRGEIPNPCTATITKGGKSFVFCNSLNKTGGVK